MKKYTLALAFLTIFAFHLKGALADHLLEQIMSPCEGHFIYNMTQEDLLGLVELQDQDTFTRHNRIFKITGTQYGFNFITRKETRTSPIEHNAFKALLDQLRQRNAHPANAQIFPVMMIYESHYTTIIQLISESDCHHYRDLFWRATLNVNFEDRQVAQFVIERADPIWLGEASLPRHENAPDLLPSGSGAGETLDACDAPPSSGECSADN